MIALVLSIAVSTLLFSCFRLFSTYKVRLEEAVVINYIVACVLSVALAGPGHALDRVTEPSSMAGALMGLAFLYMFNKIGECTQQLGLGVVAIATKMSMVLPMTVFMLLDPKDPFTWQKATAVLLAFPAVTLASSSRRNASGASGAESAAPAAPAAPAAASRPVHAEPPRSKSVPVSPFESVASLLLRIEPLITWDYGAKDGSVCFSLDGKRMAIGAGEQVHVMSVG